MMTARTKFIRKLAPSKIIKTQNMTLISFM